MGDLRPRRRHEEAKGTEAATSCSSGPSASRAASRCARTIRSAPPACSSVSSRSAREPARRSSSQRRVSTTCRYGASIRASRACLAAPAVERARAAAREGEATDLDLVEHLLDERGLRRRGGGGGERRAARQRRDDRLSRRVPAEAIEAQVRLEQAGDPALEDARAGRARPRGSRSGRTTRRSDWATARGNSDENASSPSSSGW